MDLPETNATDDGDRMLAIDAWTEAQVKLLSNLRFAYNLELNKESLGKTTYVPSEEESNQANGTHTTFTGKQVSLSQKYFSFIEALADDRKTPLEILTLLTKHYKTHYVTRQLAAIKHLSWASTLGTVCKFPLSSIIRDPELDKIVEKLNNVCKNSGIEKIKNIYKKMAMLANMWGDEDDTGILPKNIKKSDFYVNIALAMEENQQYGSSIVKNEEGRLAECRDEIAKAKLKK